jgi:hypothetical protein
MRRDIKLLVLLTFVPFLWSGTTADEYIVIGWNDLGMHCANKDFQKLCVLPPYNNIKAQVIKRGTTTTWPEIVNTGFTVDYSIPGNTYSVGKTNFWTYAFQLFGVNLPPDIGLTNVGLSGTMGTVDNNYFVDGVPLTPYQDNDLMNENPFQLALLELKDGSGTVINTTQPVIPVSNEITCVSSGCHSSETNILNEHEEEGGFNPNNTPILCASCHSSNALGTPGHPGVPSLSLAIHGKHKNITNDCYKCHPGPNTQCFRDIMHTGGMVCQDCHGSVANVASSIQNGRIPWLQEPSCGATSCHGANYAEETGKLFRQSRGHGGLFCSACHGSPHAIQPTVQPNDNVQNIALQGTSGVLRKCDVCHGFTPASGGPHGYNPTALEELPQASDDKSELQTIFPNPFSMQATIPFTVKDAAKIRIEVLTINGERVLLLLNEQMAPGTYQVKTPENMLKPGTYIVKFRSGENVDYKKMIAI